MSDESLYHLQHHEEIEITPELKSYFKESAMWGKFLAILGFIMTAIILAVGISFSFVLSDSISKVNEMPHSKLLGDTTSGAMLYTFLIYALFAATYFFPCFFLYRFSKYIKLAQATGDQFTFEKSFKNLKSMLQFMGILMALVITFYIFIIIVTILFASKLPF